MNKTSKENSRSLYFFSSRPVQVCTRAFKQTLHEDSWSCFSQHLRRGGEIRSWYHVRGGSSKSEYNNKTAHRTHNNTVSWFIPLQSNSQNAHQTRWTKPRRKPRAHCTFFWSRPVLAYSARTCSLRQDFSAGGGWRVTGSGWRVRGSGWRVKNIYENKIL